MTPGPAVQSILRWITEETTHLRSSGCPSFGTWVLRKEESSINSPLANQFALGSHFKMSDFARLGVLLLALPVAGCTRCSDKGKGGPPDASASAGASTTVPLAGTAGAGGAAGAAGSAEQAAGQPALAARQIPAGPAPNGTWTMEFALERVVGDENLDWSAAIAHCSEKGKALCLETQWQRACELDPSIGEFESWTLTADFPGAAVRGGADGCKTRSFHKIDEKSPTRIGLCCERSIALTSEETSDEFRVAATKRILETETALRSVTAEALGKLLAERVSLDGDELERSAVLSKLSDELKGDPERLSYYDHCNVKTVTEGASAQQVADCGVIQRANNRTRGFAQRIVYDSATGLVTYLGDPKAMKPREQKERVRSFLPSE